jgi:hypothetical protein
MNHLPDKFDRGTKAQVETNLKRHFLCCCKPDKLNCMFVVKGHMLLKQDKLVLQKGLPCLFVVLEIVRSNVHRLYSRLHEPACVVVCRGGVFRTFFPCLLYSPAVDFGYLVTSLSYGGHHSAFRLIARTRGAEFH